MTLSGLLAWGLFASVPVVGGWLTRRGAPGEGWAECAVRRCAAGAAAWSVVLLACAEAGLFRPAWMGAAGWVFVLAGAASRLVASRRGTVRWPVRPGAAEVAAGVVLVAVCALNVAYRYEHAIGGRDMGVYANVAVHLARAGDVSVDLPVAPADREALAPAFFPPTRDFGPTPFPGLEPRADGMTPQFGHLYPAWLAQAYAAGGPLGLYGFNALAGLLAGLAFLALGMRLVAPWLAAWGVLFLALLPPQIWLARITLSELLAQLFLLAGLLALLRGLETGRRAEAAWAGLLLGAAALVRADALAAAPLALAGLGLWRLLHGDDAVPPGRKTFAAVALGAGAAAAASYAAFSASYFWGTAAIFWGSGLLAAGALLLQLPLPGRWGTALGRVLSSPRLLWASALALGGLFGYGLLLRPQLEPFAVWHWPTHPLDGLRDFREDSLVNVSAYLTPLVVGAALLGAVAVLRALQRRQTTAGAAALTAVVLGFTFLFLHRPAIEPHHLWAARRFAPVVFPGLVLLAAVGATALGDALRGRVGRAMCVAWCLCTSALGLWLGAPWLLHREYENLHAQVAGLAGAHAGERYLFTFTPGGWSPWETPLYLMHGVRVLPLNPEDDSACEAFRAWTEQEAAGGRTVALAAETLQLPQGFDGVPRDLCSLRYGYHLPTLSLPVTGREAVERRIRFFEVVGVRWIDRVLGGETAVFIPGYSESGFWRPELREGLPPVRWTQGRATVELPLAEVRPRGLELWLDSGRPGPCQLEVLVQGRSLLRTQLARGPRFFHLPLEEVPAPGGRLRVEVVSDTFVPAQTSPGASDPRSLGVLFEGLRVVESGWNPSAEPLPPEVLRARLVELAPGRVVRGSASVPPRLPLWVVNAGKAPWSTLRELEGTPGAVRLGTLWYPLGGEGTAIAEGRGDLPHGLFPGEGVAMTLALPPTTPGGRRLPPGWYLVQVRLLQEGVQWSPSENGSLTVLVGVDP